VALAADLASIAEMLRRVSVKITGGGLGSGVIWRADGLIVTNAHVARGRNAWVTLDDGRALAATLVAWEPERDLAALAVAAGGLPAAVVGDSDTLRVGELVFAVGSPHGLGGAVTVGVIHALDSGARSGPRRWLEANLRLAPGNSGGPLADARGRVVGINAMIVAGRAVAIPSNEVERFVVGVVSSRGRAGAGRA